MNRNTVIQASVAVTVMVAVWAWAFVDYSVNTPVHPPPAYESTALVRVTDGAAATVSYLAREDGLTTSVLSPQLLQVRGVSDATGSGEAVVADWVDEYANRGWPEQVGIIQMSTDAVHHVEPRDLHRPTLIAMILTIIMGILAISVWIHRDTRESLPVRRQAHTR